MPRLTATLIAMVCSTFIDGKVQAATATPNTTIEITFRNDAHVPATILKAAQQVVNRLMDSVGIDISWNKDTSLTRGSSYTIAFVDCKVRRQAQQEGLEHTLGLVPLNSRERTVAHICYTTVLRTALTFQIPLAVLIGYTMSHEIVHLLLPNDAHATRGIMSPSWSRTDLFNMVIGQLGFTPEYRTLIGSRLSRSDVSVHH